MSHLPPHDAQLRESFVAHFTPCQRRLFLYVLTLLPDPNQAEDLFQNISLDLWRKFPQFEPGTHFYAWARQIARYEVLEFYRGAARQACTFDSRVIEKLALEAEAESDTEEEHRRALAACLKELSSADRELIEQRYLPGRTGQSVAAALGRPANSVYLSISRIRKRLLQCIERRLRQSQHQS